MIASLERRILKIPGVGRFGVFGTIAPLAMVEETLSRRTELNGPPNVHLKVTKSEAGRTIEFPGDAAHCPEQNHDILGLPLSASGRARLVGRIREMSRSGTDSIADSLKLSGKLCLAQADAMGRFGRVVFEPVYRFAARKGGNAPGQVSASLRWWSETLQLLSPRFIRGINVAFPARVFSGAAGAGPLAGRTFTGGGSHSRPILLRGGADARPKELSKAANEIFIHELFAMIAAVRKLRSVLRCRKPIPLAVNEAAAAALTRRGLLGPT